MLFVAKNRSFYLLTTHYTLLRLPTFCILAFIYKICYYITKQTFISFPLKPVKCNCNVTVAVLAGIVAGTLLGAGASQYAYVVAGFKPNDAKNLAEQRYHGAPTTDSVRYSNTRALRLNLERGEGEGYRVRDREVQRRDVVNFDENKYAAEGECAGMSGKRRHVCEAEN